MEKNCEKAWKEEYLLSCDIYIYIILGIIF